MVKVTNGGDFKLSLGEVMLTRAGREIESLVVVDPLEGYLEECIKQWEKDENLIFSSVRTLNQKEGELS